MLNPHRQNRNQLRDQALAEQIELTCQALPEMAGLPVGVEVLPSLSVVHGKLVSGKERGRAVYAASFIRERRVVIEAELLENPGCLRSILVHELFHFVWTRLGNTRRASYRLLLECERHGRARGELGDSSFTSKRDSPDSELRWKHYACESFCDTAAYLVTGCFAGDPGSLKNRWLDRRRAWFQDESARSWRF